MTNQPMNSVKAQLEAIKQQQNAVAEMHDLLHVGLFVGANSQKVTMSQAYAKGLHDAIAKEVKRLEELLAAEMTPTFTESLTEQVKA